MKNLLMLIVSIWTLSASAGQVITLDKGSISNLDPVYVPFQEVYVLKIRVIGQTEALTFMTSSQSDFRKMIEDLRQVNLGKTRQERVLVEETCDQYNTCTRKYAYREVPIQMVLTIDHMNDIMNWELVD